MFPYRLIRFLNFTIWFIIIKFFRLWRLWITLLARVARIFAFFHVKQWVFAWWTLRTKRILLIIQHGWFFTFLHSGKHFYKLFISLCILQLLRRRLHRLPFALLCLMTLFSLIHIIANSMWWTTNTRIFIYNFNRFLLLSFDICRKNDFNTYKALYEVFEFALLFVIYWYEIRVYLFLLSFIYHLQLRFHNYFLASPFKLFISRSLPKPTTKFKPWHITRSDIFVNLTVEIILEFLFWWWVTFFYIFKEMIHKINSTLLFTYSIFLIDVWWLWIYFLNSSCVLF